MKNSSRSPLKYFGHAANLTLLFIASSTLIYYIIGRGQWSLFDCFYMTMISITTVGYGEILDISGNVLARSFSILVVLWGYALLVYLISLLADLLVTGEIREYFFKRKVRNMVDSFQNHFIVCGFGEMGFHVAREIIATGNPLLIIDNDQRIYDLVAEKFPGISVPVIQGDASDENILNEAGIDKAAGMVLTLSEDKDNLFSLVTARSINPELKIATKIVHEKNSSLFINAGAYKVMSPAAIGGLRLASELLRPAATNFLDVMLRDKQKNLRIGEILLTEKMECINKTLRESDFRAKTNILIMAVAFENGDFVYNPPADLKLVPGYRLIVLGESQDIKQFSARL